MAEMKSKSSSPKDKGNPAAAIEHAGMELGSPFREVTFALAKAVRAGDTLALTKKPKGTRRSVLAWARSYAPEYFPPGVEITKAEAVCGLVARFRDPTGLSLDAAQPLNARPLADLSLDERATLATVYLLCLDHPLSRSPFPKPKTKHLADVRMATKKLLASAGDDPLRLARAALRGWGLSGNAVDNLFRHVCEA